MKELSFTSYVEVIRPFLMKNSSAEDAAMFLMDSIAKQLDADEGKKKKDIRKDGTLKKILRGIAMVPEDIRLASAKKTVVEGVQKYFHTEVLQDLNPHLIFTLIYGLGIYLSTLITIIVTGEFSQSLMAFAFFFSIGLFVFLEGFYFFLWRRDI